jgi:hypothetical protein
MESRTIVDLELPLEVAYNYFSAEKAETGPEAKYPGAPEIIEITKVFLFGSDITKNLSDRMMERVHRELEFQIEMGREFEESLTD